MRAVNSVGDGTASASLTETTETTVPGAPTSLASTPAATSVALTWTAPNRYGWREHHRLRTALPSRFDSRRNVDIIRTNDYILHTDRA